MANFDAMLTSSNQFWCSPQNVADAVHEFYMGPPDFDPAGSPDAILGTTLQYVKPRSVPQERAAAAKKMKRELTSDEARFVRDVAWEFNRRCKEDESIKWRNSLRDEIWNPFGEGVHNWNAFMNHPYDQNEAFMSRLVATVAHHKQCHFVTLIAARPSANWFQNHVFKSADAILFYDKRLKMLGGKYSAPFDSVTSYHGNNVGGFVKAFGHLGTIVK